MTRSARRTAAIAAVVAVVALAGGALLVRHLPVSGFIAFPTADPESLGLDSTRLETLWERLQAARTDAFLVSRGGHLVFERYTRWHGWWRREGIASGAKAIVAGLSLVLAAGDGRVSLDDPASRFFPTWREDSLRSGITLRHLATHTAGFRPLDTPGSAPWQRAYWRRTPDLFTHAIHDVPMDAVPGTRFHYDSMAFAALAYVSAAALHDSSDADLVDVLDRRIMRPIGIPRSAWRIGYAEPPHRVDGLSVYLVGSGASFTARALARIGQLVLLHGRWENHEVLDSAALAHAVSDPPPALPRPGLWPAPGIGWWTNQNAAWPELPSDAFAAVGGNGQVLLLIPSLDLVVVRLGGAPGSDGWGDRFWRDIRERFFAPVARVLPGSG